MSTERKFQRSIDQSIKHSNMRRDRDVMTSLRIKLHKTVVQLDSGYTVLQHYRSPATTN